MWNTGYNSTLYKLSGGFMEEFIIKKDLAQAILDYLATKPYREVFTLIANIQGLKKIPETPKEEKID